MPMEARVVAIIDNKFNKYLGIKNMIFTFNLARDLLK